MQKSSRSTMAPGAGRNIRMMGCLRRRRAVQIRTQGAQTGLVVISQYLESSSTCVGSFALCICDVIAAMITVELYLFPASF